MINFLQACLHRLRSISSLGLGYQDTEFSNSANKTNLSPKGKLIYCSDDSNHCFICLNFLHVLVMNLSKHTATGWGEKVGLGWTG